MLHERGLHAIVGAVLGLLLILLASGAARAGTFDAAGDLQLDPTDVASIDFETSPQRYFPSGTAAGCMAPGFQIVTAPDALQGASYAHLHVAAGCAERFPFALPAEQGSYHVTLWMRHGRLDANLDIDYTTSSGLDTFPVFLAPTGRTTSDGWVELATNPFPVDGTNLQRAYLHVVDSASLLGVDIDAFEVVRDGVFFPEASCAGLGDPACTSEQVCMYNKCVLGGASVPPCRRP